jgi:polyisoprenoid-binding protein YceI
MKSFLLLLAASSLPVSALRAADEHKLSGDNTTIKFTGTKKDGKHEGSFKKLDGTLSVDPADMTKSKLEVTIDIASMTTDDAKLTNHLKGPDFFDAKAHPKAKFVSKSISADKDAKDKYTVTGELTMHGKTHPVTFPATAATADGTTTVSGEVAINRNDWGISYGKGKVDDAVKLNLEVKLKAKAK